MRRNWKKTAVIVAGTAAVVLAGAALVRWRRQQRAIPTKDNSPASEPTPARRSNSDDVSGSKPSPRPHVEQRGEPGSQVATEVRQDVAHAGSGTPAGIGASVTPGASGSPIAQPAPAVGAAQPRPAPPMPALAQGLLQNEDLVHRLVVDPDFRLPHNTPDPLLDWSVPIEEAGGTTTAMGAGRTPHGDAEVAAAMIGADPSLFSFPDTRSKALRRSVKFWVAVIGGTPTRATNHIIVDAIRGVQEGLAALTPNNKQIRDDLYKAVDLPHITHLLENDLYTAELLLQLLQLFAGHIASSEAPVHAQETRAWIAAAVAAINRIAGSPEVAAAANPARLPLRDLLPRVFAWLFTKIDEIRIDAANFHLSVLAPYLVRDGHGADYERGKFETARASGHVGLEGTVVWLADAITGSCEGKDNAAKAEFIQRLKIDDRTFRLQLLVEGAMRLLRRPTALVADAARASFQRSRHRQLNPQHGAGGEASKKRNAWFPESMARDAVMMTEMQNDLQRICLSASLVYTLRAVLSSCRPFAEGAVVAADPRDTESAATFEELVEHLNSWLSSDSIDRESLIVGITSAARRIAFEQKRVMGDQHVDVVKRVVELGVSTDNATFALFLGRATAIIQLAAMTVLKQLQGVSNDMEMPGRMQAAASAGAGPLKYWMQELETMGVRLTRIMAHNEQVFAPYYRGLLIQLHSQLK